jgi:phenylpropionate dioxygenase-like ring-hydroxylating dioxygenase large terminal subunit
VKVLDAFCPHMGAHLGHGGKVQGDTVTCPFHAWKFDGDGKCVEVPYATRIPPQAKIACWPVLDINGAIFVWHDVDKRAPLWELPVAPEFGSPDWTTPYRKEWRFRTHNQEMAENVVDKAHFKYLHGTVNMPATEVEFDGPHIHMVSPTTMTARGGEVEGQVETHSHGLGFSTNRFTGIVETLLMGCVAPIDDEWVHVRFSFTVKKLPGEGMEGVMKGIGKAFVGEITRQLEQDAPVWENKIYLERPMLCDGDGPVGQFRRWAAQFYPDWYKQQAREAYDAARR